MLIKRAATYREIYDSFHWEVPARFNMAVACCDRWAADPGRVALIHEQADGQVRRYGFAELRELSTRCANMLVALGLDRGDRVQLTSVASMAGVPPSTGRRWARKLVDRGLLEREKDRRDQRQTYVRLTAKGQEIMTAFMVRLAAKGLPSLLN